MIKYVFAQSLPEYTDTIELAKCATLLRLLQTGWDDRMELSWNTAPKYVLQTASKYS